MTTIGAWIFLAGSAVTVAFHTAMMLGAPWGHLTMGGRWAGALPLPARGLSAVSAAVILLMASVSSRPERAFCRGDSLAGPSMRYWRF